MIEILKQLRNGHSLSSKEMEHAIAQILDHQATHAQIGSFLMGLSQRGETSTEISTAAQMLRNRASLLHSPPDTIDCCGTGGDHSNSLNISTAVAFVVAACGVPVAKHGNRASSSQSGAADVLEELDVNLTLTKDQCEHALKTIGFCFLMAPHHHTSLKPLAALRKEMGFRTIFNLIGPLINPANTKRQLVGVFDKNFIKPIAESLRELGTENAWVVHGSDGMDEITLTGSTHVAQLKNGQITETEITPDDFDLPFINEKDIEGKNASYNASELKKILDGHKNAYRDIVLANAAAALIVAQKTDSLKDAVRLASQAIDTHQAKNVFETYRDFTHNQQ